MMVCSGASQRWTLMRSATCLAGLNVRRLHIDSADAELLVSEALLIVRRHVVLDQIAIALDAANEISLVAADIEVAMADLPVIIGADRVVALTDMHHDVHVLGQALDAHVDDLDRRIEPPRRSTA